MPTGTVKWFNPTKGYGFIAPRVAAFVHASAVARAGISGLNRGTSSRTRTCHEQGQNISGESENVHRVEQIREPQTGEASAA